MRRLVMLLVLAALTATSGLALAKPGKGSGKSSSGRSWNITMSMSRGRLGVEVMSMTPELRAYFKAPRDAGVLISRVTDGSPADQARLKVGDVITEVASQPVDSPFDVRKALGEYRKGEQVVLTLVRHHKRIQRTATLADDPLDAGVFGDFDFDFGFDFPDLPDWPGLDRDWLNKHFRFKSKGLKKQRKPPKSTPGSPALRKRLHDLERRLRKLERRLQKGGRT